MDNHTRPIRERTGNIVMGRNRKMTTDLYELNRIANMEINTLKVELAKVNKGSQRNAHVNQSLVKQLEAAEARAAELESNLEIAEARFKEAEYMEDEAIKQAEAAEARADIAEGRIYDLNARLEELNYDIIPELQSSLAAAERTLQAMRNIVHGWENSNYDEQDCLHYLVKALHMEPNNETTED